MELRQLRYFERAAELLNFTEAARTLFISQSTLSQQVKQLEEELGVLLFNRVGKHIELTEAGTFFLPYARNTIRDADSGKQIIQDLQELHTGSLRIGITYSLGSLLTKTLTRFAHQYPHIQVEITFSTSDELIDKLIRNKVDIILSLESGKNSDEFETMPLFSSSVHLIIHRTHSLANIKSIGFEDIANIPLILPAKGFITREMLDEAFLRRNIKPDIRMELNDVNAILKLLDRGHWGTMLTSASVKDEPELVSIPIIPDKELTTHASLFWLKGIYRKKSVVAFTEILDTIVKMEG